MKRIFLLILVLSACGGAEPPVDDNYGYGYTYDYIDEPTGLRVRYDNTPHHTQLSEFVSAYYAAQECAGLTGEGPLVVITTDRTFDILGYPATAVYLPESNTILIPSYVLEDGRDFKFYLFWHETIHHLLYLNGFDQAKNNNHDSVLFSDCVNIYK